LHYFKGFFSLSSLAGLECYKCNDSTCSDASKDDFGEVSTCLQGWNFCYKATNKEGMVERACIFSDEVEEAGGWKFYYCEKDGCNDAHDAKRTWTASAVAASFFVAITINKLM
jgi:hypothetical protein